MIPAPAPNTLAWMARAAFVSGFFLWHCTMINLAQISLLPLLLVSPAFFRKGVAQTERWFGAILIAMSQLFAPTTFIFTGEGSDWWEDGLTSRALGEPFISPRSIVMANHQIYTDWVYLWHLAYLGGRDGDVKIILKDSLKHIPIYGWGMRIMRFIFLSRQWKKDQVTLSNYLQHYRDCTDDDLCLLLFPEGTVPSPNTRPKSKAYADKLGLKDPRHCLLPHSTGLSFCLAHLGTSITHLHDVTIGYEGIPPDTYPQKTYDIVKTYYHAKAPPKVHMHLRSWPIEKVPYQDPDTFSSWLHQRWLEKDALLDTYYTTGHFPCPEGPPVEWEAGLTSWFKDLAGLWAISATVPLILWILASG